MSKKMRSCRLTMSLPAWGVRVEMNLRVPTWFALKSLPAWGVRVEMNLRVPTWFALKSLPAWGVRVEICR